MSNSIFDTREGWLNAFVEASRGHFENAGYPLPDKIRVSVGFTSGGKRGTSIGECWSSEASDDGHFEIFIRPNQESDARIADILTHELCHAAVGLQARHGPTFKACAQALGLEGRMTATVAGELWYELFLPVLTALGPIPHAKLTEGQSSAKPKQKTYLLKVECDQCGWLARVSSKHIEAHSHLNCPVPDCDGTLQGED